MIDSDLGFYWSRSGSTNSSEFDDAHNVVVTKDRLGGDFETAVRGTACSRVVSESCVVTRFLRPSLGRVGQISARAAVVSLSSQ
jgi:hypothetical protein